MAGHLARNQVHAGSIPAALTGEPAGAERRLASDAGRVQLPCSPHFLGQCSWESSRSPKPTNSVRIVADPRRGPNGLGYHHEWIPRGQQPRPRAWKAPLNGRQRVPKTRVVALSPRGSIPPPSSAETTCMSVLHTRVLSERAAAPGVRLSPSPPSGSVSEWRGDGLQNRLRRFESDRSLRQYAPLSERLGPGLPNRRGEFDSRTVLCAGGPRQLGGEPASRAAFVPQKR